MENIGQLASWYSEYGSIYIYIHTSLSGGTCHKIANVQATQRYQAELQDFVDGSLATFQELKLRCKKRKAWLARLHFSRSLATWLLQGSSRKTQIFEYSTIWLKRLKARGPRDLFPQTAEHAPASGRWKRRHALKYMMKTESTACISQSRLTTAKTSHPRNRTALGWLHRFRTDFQRWIRLFATRGQVISDESWRIDIQSSSTVRGYWWALQGPGQPSPIYANAKADYDINRFPDIVAAPYVAIALERSWADSFTWRIRVSIEEKRERKRPRAKCSESPGCSLLLVWPHPQKEVKEPIVEKESHHLDANGKFLCWKTIEQVPNKKALGIGTRMRGYLFSEACSPASEQLWISLGYLEEMWAGLKKLMADQQQLEELLGNMMAHDNVHGALDVGTGSAGVASGGLMAAGFLFPPLFVVGAAGGGAQVAKGECFFGKTLSTYCLRELMKMQWIGGVWTIWRIACRRTDRLFFKLFRWRQSIWHGRWGEPPQCWAVPEHVLLWSCVMLMMSYMLSQLIDFSFP